MKNRLFTILAGTLIALTIELGMVVIQESAVAQEPAAANPDPMQFAREATIGFVGQFHHGTWR